MNKANAEEKNFAKPAAKRRRSPSDDRDRVSIANNIREARLKRRLTLADIAGHSGLAISTISKIENGVVSPSFDTILKISRALNLSFESLLEGHGREHVSGRRALTRSNVVRFETDQYKYAVHADDLTNKKMIPLIMEIKNRNIDINTVWSSHSGEEFILVLSGEIDFHCGSYQKARLSAGESAYIDSGMKHAFVSVGPENARILSICLQDEEGGAVQEFVRVMRPS